MIWPFRRPAPRLATRLAITPPQPAAQRVPLALVLIAKNEARHIADWLAFHALAGVDHVILYDNGSTDETVEIVRNFTGCATTIVPWQLTASEAKTGMALHQQVVAYAHAICTFGGSFKRMGFIDTDEYLVPRDTMTLPEALAAIDHPNISLPWAMYGHGGHKTSPDAAVPFAFLERAPVSEGPLLNYKCIVDPCLVNLVNIHRFETTTLGDLTTNTVHRVVPNKHRSGDFVSHSGIQLNHYYLMSEEDMEAKTKGFAVSGSLPTQRAAAIRRKAAIIEASPIKDGAAVDFLERHQIMGTTDLRQCFSSLVKT